MSNTACTQLIYNVDKQGIEKVLYLGESRPPRGVATAFVISKAGQESRGSKLQDSRIFLRSAMEYVLSIGELFLPPGVLIVASSQESTRSLVCKGSSFFFALVAENIAHN